MNNEIGMTTFQESPEDKIRHSLDSIRYWAEKILNQQAPYSESQIEMANYVISMNKTSATMIIDKINEINKGE